MKHHCLMKPHLLLTLAFLLLYLQLSSAQSQNFTLQPINLEENSPLILQYGEPMPPPTKMSPNFELNPVFLPGVYSNRYEIEMTTIGIWYLSVYSCGLPVDLAIEDRNGVLNINTVRIGGYEYREYNGIEAIERGAGKFRSVWLTIPEDSDWMGKIEILSALIEEEEYSFYYLEEEAKNITVKKTHENEANQLIIIFDPLKFTQFKATDQIEYQVELLTDDPVINCKKGLVTYRVPGMVNSSLEITVPIDHKEEITMNFTDVPDSYINNYFIRIKAYVIHGSRKIQYFTYPIAHQNSQTSKKDNLHIMALEIAALAFLVIIVIVGFQYSSKVRGWIKGKAAGEHQALEDERDVDFHEQANDV